MAVALAVSYVTAAGTAAPEESRSVNELVVTEAGARASLNVAVTFDVSPTASDPAVGLTLTTEGAVPSPALFVSKTTSTQ
jgi:hypothetical protein